MFMNSQLSQSHCESTATILPKTMLLESVPLNNQWINNKKAAPLFTRVYQFVYLIWQIFATKALPDTTLPETCASLQS